MIDYAIAEPLLVGMLTNRVLAKTAAIGGFAVLASAAFFKWRIENGLKQSEYYKTAMQRLRESEAIRQALGPPVRVGNFDLGDNGANYCDGSKARFKVPVRGSRDSGFVIFEAFRDQMTGCWSVADLELFLDSDSTKKLVVRPPRT